MIGLATFIVHYLLVFVLCACLWRVLYVVEPCISEMRGWPNPPACSTATLLHRATVPGPQDDWHYLSVAIVALLIVVIWLLLELARSARRTLPKLLAFVFLLVCIAMPCVGLAWLLATVRPCLLDLLETPSYLAMCFALREMLTDTPANPISWELTALFLAAAIATLWWRWDGMREK